MCPYVEQRTYPTLIRWMLGLPSQPHRRRRIHFVSAAAAAPSLQTCRSCPAKAKLLSRTSAEVISANFRTDLRQHSLSWVTKWERVSEIVHPLPRIKVLWGNVWLISQGSCSCWSCAAPESNFFFFCVTSWFPFLAQIDLGETKLTTADPVFSSGGSAALTGVWRGTENNTFYNTKLSLSISSSRHICFCAAADKFIIQSPFITLPLRPAARLTSKIFKKKKKKKDK